MPEAIAHYTILDHVGRGGLGELYRARDTRLGRTVALRVLPASLVDPPESLENLVRVARSAAALSHPNVAALFEIGADGARHYLAFEYVSGELLSTKLRGRPLEVRSAVDFAIQLADALAKGEEQQLSHGDIRPETIVITSKGRPKLIHYGLSEFTSSGIARRASAPSPAPTEGTDREGALRDIRALGLVIYEMLTGRPPAASQPASAAASPAAVKWTVWSAGRSRRIPKSGIRPQQRSRPNCELLPPFWTPGRPPPVPRRRWMTRRRDTGGRSSPYFCSRRWRPWSGGFYD
jgi:eukaryotic-like serine/threonine-protein kinase